MSSAKVAKERLQWCVKTGRDGGWWEPVLQTKAGMLNVPLGPLIFIVPTVLVARWHYA